MKKSCKIALYSLYGGDPDHAKEATDHVEEDKDYTRHTEIVEVEFTMLPTEVVQEKLIEACQAEIDYERAQHLRKMHRLDEKMAKLRALPAPEVELGPGYDGEEDVVFPNG